MPDIIPDREIASRSCRYVRTPAASKYEPMQRLKRGGLHFDLKFSSKKMMRNPSDPVLYSYPDF